MMASCIAGTADASPQALRDLWSQVRFLCHCLLAGDHLGSQERNGKMSMRIDIERLCLSSRSKTLVHPAREVYQGPCVLAVLAAL